MSRCLWLSFCLVSLLLFAPARSADAASGGPLLNVSVTSTDVHPGDYVSLFVSALASYNDTAVNVSRGPILIKALDSNGANVSPLSGLHELVNGTFGLGWRIPEDPIDFVSVIVGDLYTGLVSVVQIDVAPSWSQVSRDVNRTLSRIGADLQADNERQNAERWLLFYVTAATLVGLGVAVVVAAENGLAHKSSPRRMSWWDRAKAWVRISRSPIPDVVDLAFSDPENVYEDVKLKAQLEILERRDLYLNETRAQLRLVEREIQRLPPTRDALKERWTKARRELGLDAEWEA